MAHVKADRVQETTTTTGTGALTLAGATAKFRAFSAALADTDTCVCLIEHASAAEWEVSLCTFASGAGTLTRSTIYAGTNGGSAVNFSAGTKTISLLPTASKMIVADNADTTTIPGALLPASNDGGALGSATLSFSDGFFASGAVLNFANGNYTVTHSSGALVFSAAAGTVTLTTTGTSGARQGVALNAVNSSPASNDDVYLSGQLTNSAAAQIEFGRVTFRAGTVTAGSESGHVRLGVRASGAISDRIVLTTFNLGPISNDGVALGLTATAYQDLFLASGGIIGWANGNYSLTHSSGLVTASGAFLSAGSTGGVGYGTGAGGTVTQATSKSTGVTLNKVCGQITMNNAALAADARVTFTVTNSAVATTDVVVANIDSGGTADAYLVYVTAVGAGSFNLTVENATAGSLSEAPVISFAVIKGVTS